MGLRVDHVMIWRDRLQDVEHGMIPTHRGNSCQKSELFQQDLIRPPCLGMPIHVLTFCLLESNRTNLFLDAKGWPVVPGAFLMTRRVTMKGQKMGAWTFDLPGGNPGGYVAVPNASQRYIQTLDSVGYITCVIICGVTCMHTYYTHIYIYTDKWPNGQKIENVDMIDICSLTSHCSLGNP